jgi:DNA-binding NtrC family response regulator
VRGEVLAGVLGSLASDRSGGPVNVRSSSPGALARLLAWDAPFLPVVSTVTATPDGVEVAIDVQGTGLPEVCRWPRAQRAAVALQALAAGAFLFERGWYPSRSLLRGARVVRDEAGPWLRLATLPGHRLEDTTLERRLRLALGTGDNVLVAAFASLLRALLPERARELERVAVSRPAWESVEACTEMLLGEGRGGSVLRHPAGKGRALWARRFSLPQEGVFWVEEEQLVSVVGVAAQLAALGRDLSVSTGSFEEGDVARIQARAAADGRDCLVLTTLSLPGVPALPLAGEADAVWVLTQDGGLGRAHAAAATETGLHRPALAREMLEEGAAHGFAREPRPVATRGRESLASPQARRALGWLEAAPVGLGGVDLELLGGPCRDALAELERLGLAQPRHGAWRALRPAEAPSRDVLGLMADKLPPESAPGIVARGLAQGRHAEALAWCEAALAAGRAGEALAVARSLAAVPGLCLAGAEAALVMGELIEADRLLERVAPGERDGRWHALAAWWAEQSGLSERAEAEVGAATEALPSHLAARLELVAADLTRRRGDREEERRHLHRAVALTAPPLADAELALAAATGPAALRALGKARASAWNGDQKARLLQFLGLAALDGGSCTAAATALRAALRTATGSNLRLLGEIHADLGCAAILSEQGAVADRHLRLAEGLLERCGSRRAVTLVRPNRAVLACDRLDWRTCRQLNVASREVRGALDDATTWLGELELARAELARGDVAAVQALLPGLEEGVGRHRDHTTLMQTLAALRAHLALALGDLEGAASAASGADPGERELILAVERAEGGIDPPIALPQRWGVAITAQLLASWRRGDQQAARRRLALALERTPREAAVGLARFAALLARRGQHIPATWVDCERAAEAALASAELDGWTGIMRGACGHDPVRVVQALDGIVNAGTDALAAPRLEALARALGLEWVEVARGGAPLGSWGIPRGETLEILADGVRVQVSGAVHTLAHAAITLVARHLATGPGDDGAEGLGRTGDLLGSSPAIAAVREQIARWGPLPLTVLVTGEPGTGKELVARELHRRSGRAGPFVPVNCAGIPGALLEAELFGVVKGAFTGADRDRPGLVEAAEGGTLFLDEVGELPAEIQAKLLRLLQGFEVRRVGATRSRVVDVRFVAATNRDLRAAMASGAFRQDLYYRLAVAVIEVPPLREHPEDVDVLARTFAARLATSLKRPGVCVAPATVELLRRGSWPGNVRELETVMIRAVAAARPGEVLGPDRFPGVVPVPASERPFRAWGDALAEFRRAYFTRLLRESGGNRTRAARRAGISRQTLLYHLRELGIRGRDEG